MKKFVLNRVDMGGNIISGYQDIIEVEASEQAVSDYLYFLSSSEGIENPKCECVEVDWEEKSVEITPCNCGSGESVHTCSVPYGWEFCG